MLLCDIRMAELKGFGFCLFWVFLPIKKRIVKKGNGVSLSTRIALIFRVFWRGSCFPERKKECLVVNYITREQILNLCN